jgi:hypothetical protein
MNLSEELAHDIFHLFAFPLGSFPIKYLGVPLHYDNLRREDIQPLVDKLLRRIAGWIICCKSCVDQSMFD